MKLPKEVPHIIMISCAASERDSYNLSWRCMMHYIGIDFHKESTHVVVLNEAEEIFESADPQPARRVGSVFRQPTGTSQSGLGGDAQLVLGV